MGRRLKTLIYLSGATLLSGIGSLFDDSYLLFFSAFACVIFAIALIISNYNYRRYKFSTAIVITAYIVIFLYGTLPFAGLSLLIIGIPPEGITNYASIAFGMFGGFLLCLTVFAMCYKGVSFNWMTILMIIIFPFIAFELLQIPWSDTFKPFGSLIIIFQPLLTLIMIASIKTKGRASETNLKHTTS